MKILTYKGHKLGNSVSMYMHYKAISNRNLTSDLAKLSGIAKIAAKLESNEGLTEAEEKCLAENDVMEIVLFLWCSLRYAGDKEARDLSPEDLMEELDSEDLSNDDFIGILVNLLSSKKKDHRAGLFKKQ